MDVASSYFYYDGAGAGKRGATPPSEPEPTEVLVIHDTFTALALDAALNGWTPDTVNTSGNNWDELVSGRNEGDGLGRVERDASTSKVQIDTEITDNRIRVELEAETVTTKQLLFVVILATATWATFDTSSALQLIHLNGSDTLILETNINGSVSTIGSAVVARTADVVHKYALEFDGADVRAYFDDAEVAALAQVGYALPAAFDGNSFVGTAGNPVVFWDNFKVWDLP
jgi:hypothetical protein